jgi:hypothetical protein
MDKKYKAIKTINELNLSGRPSSSFSNISGKSDFSNVSAEKRFNEAYAKDFSVSPKKIAKDKLSPPKLRPRKLPTLKDKPEVKPKDKSKDKPEDKIKYPKLPNLYQEYLDGKREIGIPVFDVKTGEFGDYNIDRVQRNLLTHIKDEKLKEWVKKAVKDIKKDWKKTDPEVREGLGYLFDLIKLDYFKKNQDWEGKPLKN